MAYNLKGITLKIGADISGLESQLRKIKAETSGLDKTFNNLKRSMKFDPKLETEYRNLSVSQDLLATKIGSVSKQWNAASQKVIEQQSAMKKLRTEIDNVDTSTEKGRASAKQLEDQYQNLAQQTQATKATEQALHNQMIELSNSFISTDATVLKTYSSLAKVANVSEDLASKTKMLSMVSAGALTAGAAAAISFEDAFTGVTKTVDATPAQFEKINKGLKELAVTTTSTYQDIAHYAELAGQMGVPTEAIVGFTRTITELGDTTNLVGEEAAQSIAKFSNVMVSQSEKTNTYYSRLGSTLVDLGNKFATTEKDIMEMSTRLAVAGRQVGFTSPQVLGLSTALSSLGIGAEAGGGAVSKMLKRIQLAVSTGGDDLNKFAQVAGMSSEEFQKAWGENAANAFLKFVQGIGKSGDVTKTLDELNIKEVRQAQAMGALAQSSDVLEQALQTSGTAWAQNTAMATEAEKRYSTMKSQIHQAVEAIKQAFAALGESMAPVITNIAGGIKSVALAFANLPDGVRRSIGTFVLFNAALSPTLKLTSKFAGGVQNVIGFLGSMGSKASAQAGNLRAMAAALKTAEGASSAASASLEAQAATLESVGSAATAAQAKIVAFLPVVAGIGAVIGVVATEVLIAKKRHDELIESARKEMETNDALYASTRRVITGYDDYESRVDSLKQSADSAMTSYQEQAAKTDVLINRISQLSQVENLNASQKALMKEAVNELTSIYPDFQYKIDETTGKLVDQNGNVVTNTQSLKEYANQLKDAAEKQAQAQALLAKSTAYAEQKAEVQALSDSLKELRSRQKEIIMEESQGNFKHAAQLDALNKDIDETKTKLQESQKELKLTGKEVENLGNTVNATDFDETMKTKLDGLTKSAKEAGIKIPKALAQAIKDGKGDVDAATSYMDTYDKYQEMITKAGEAGTAIPQSLATGMINNAKTVQDQVDIMNTLISFQGVADKAKENGTQIPINIAQGMIQNLGSVQEQVNAMNALMTFQEAVTNAGIDGSLIPQNLIQGIINGANGAEGGVSIDAANQRINDAITFQQAAQKAGIEGTQTTQNLVSGILSGEVSVSTATNHINDLVKFEQAVKNAGMEGTEVANNLARSIAAGEMTVEQASNQLAQATNQSGTAAAAGAETGQAFVNALGSAISGAIGGIIGTVQGIFAQAKAGVASLTGRSYASSIQDRIAELPSYINAEYAIPEIRTIMPMGFNDLSPRRLAMLQAATTASIGIASHSVTPVPTYLSYGLSTQSILKNGGVFNGIIEKLSSIEKRVYELERPVETTLHVISTLDGDKVSDSVITKIEKITNGEDKSRGV